MVDRAQTKTVLAFVGASFVLDWDDVGSVNKVELYPADGATMALSCQDVFPEPGVAHFAVDSFEYSSLRVYFRRRPPNLPPARQEATLVVIRAPL